MIAALCKTYFLFTGPLFLPTGRTVHSVSKTLNVGEREGAKGISSSRLNKKFWKDEHNGSTVFFTVFRMPPYIPHTTHTHTHTHTNTQV